MTEAGLRKAAQSTLYVDGDKVGAGRVEGTVPMIFSGDETDRRRFGHSFSGQRRLWASRSNVFNGRVEWVQIDLGEDAEDADHLITPEERLRVAMARQ